MSSSNSLFLEILYGVDWTEPWLLCLLAFHLLTALAPVLLSNHVYLQAAILAVLAFLCFASEWINEYAALNSSLFSKEQYFDPNGFFIFTVFSGPIILNCFLIVLSWLWQVWNMMVKMGRMKRQRQKVDKEPTQKETPKSAAQSKKNQ